MDYSQVLGQVRQNKEMMQNPTIQNVFTCLDNKDHAGLVQLYRNTCNTFGQQPNQMFLK